MLKEGPGGIQEAGTGTEGTAGRASVKSQALDTSNLGKVENKVIYLKQDTRYSMHCIYHISTFFKDFEEAERERVQIYLYQRVHASSSIS